MLLANVRRLFLPVLGFLIPYCAPNFCSGFLLPPAMLETFSCSTYDYIFSSQFAVLYLFHNRSERKAQLWIQIY
jgi:hypothetical protein